MGIRKRFNEIFGLEDSVEDERKRFVQRVNQIIFHDIDTEHCDEFAYRDLFDLVCFELGVNAHDFQERGVESKTDFLPDLIPAPIRTLTKDDFNETLRVVCALYIHIQLVSDRERGRKWLSEFIEVALSRCTRDVGVRWKDGFFYPSGAEELDKSLVDETLTWLSDYPPEKQNYQRALQCRVVGDAFTDVITNCYLAVEGVARQVLGNQKTLDNNKDELLKRIDLSEGWKSILATYIKYAHDYRHASQDRHDITKQEAEAYLYMTGLIIRLVIESK